MKKLITSIAALFIALAFAVSANAKSNKEAVSSNISRGHASKAEVMKIQQALAAKSFYPYNVTGQFGLVTERAVMNFQRANGLWIDGVVGEQTQEALNRPTAQGNFSYKGSRAKMQIPAKKAGVALKRSQIPPAKINDRPIMVKLAQSVNQEVSVMVPSGSQKSFSRPTSYRRYETKKDKYTWAGKTCTKVPVMFEKPGKFGVAAVPRRFRGWLVTIVDDHYQVRRFLGCDWSLKVEVGWAARKLATKLHLSSKSKEFNAIVVDTCTIGELKKDHYCEVYMTPNPDPRKFDSLTKEQQLAYLNPAMWGLPTENLMIASTVKASSR